MSKTGTSRLQKRILDSAAAIASEQPDEIAYTHTVFAQTGLPYRNPGANVRVWERSNGAATLLVEAGRALCPGTNRFVELSLPYGPKPRLILAYLNSEAVRRGDPRIDVGRSMTEFVRRLGFSATGRDISTFKAQMSSLAASTLRLGVYIPEVDSARTRNIKTDIIQEFDLWFSKDENQRVLWPSYVRLSHDYFQSLMTHAVPLDERALAALRESTMGLDIYCWLAQRLHRIPDGQKVLVPWTRVHEQFGAGWKYLRQFRPTFIETLKVVQTQYLPARVSVREREGLVLERSPPPVARHLHVVSESIGQPAATSVDGQVDTGHRKVSDGLEISEQTVTQVRAMFPGQDVEKLIQSWRNWNLRRGVTPQNPDKAFLGWATKVKRNGK